MNLLCMNQRMIFNLWKCIKNLIKSSMRLALKEIQKQYGALSGVSNRTGELIPRNMKRKSEMALKSFLRPPFTFLFKYSRIQKYAAVGLSQLIDVHCTDKSTNRPAHVRLTERTRSIYERLKARRKRPANI